MKRTKKVKPEKYRNASPHRDGAAPGSRRSRSKSPTGPTTRRVAADSPPTKKSDMRTAQTSRGKSKSRGLSRSPNHKFLKESVYQQESEIELLFRAHSRRTDEGQYMASLHNQEMEDHIL